MGGLADLQRRPPILTCAIASRGTGQTAASREFGREPAGLSFLRARQKVSPLARAQSQGSLAQHHSLDPDGGNIRRARNRNAPLPLRFWRRRRSSAVQPRSVDPGGGLWSIRAGLSRAASPIRPAAERP